MTTTSSSENPASSGPPATEKNAYIAFENETGEVAKMAVLRPSQPPLDAPHDPIAQTAMSALSLGLVARQNEPTITRHVDSTPTPANTKRALTPPRSVLPPITPPPPPPARNDEDPPSDEDFEVKTLARRLFGDPRPSPEPADTGETASYKSEEETLARPLSSQANPPNGSVLLKEEEKETLTSKRAAHLDEEVDTLSRGSSPPPIPRDALPPPPPSSTKGATAILDTTTQGSGAAKKQMRESIAELAATTTPFPYPPLDPSPGPGTAIRTPLVMITSPEDNATRIQPMVYPAVNAASLNQPTTTNQPASAHQSYPPHSVPARSSNNGPIPFPEFFRQATSNAAPIQKVAMFIIGTLIVAIVSFLVIRPAHTAQQQQQAANNNNNNKPAAAANPTPVLMAPIDPLPPAVVVPPVATTTPAPPTTTTVATPAPTASTKAADPPAKRRVVTRPVPRANIPVRREQ